MKSSSRLLIKNRLPALCIGLLFTACATHPNLHTPNEAEVRHSDMPQIQIPYIYPQDAVTKGLEGNVVLWVRISAQGHCESARIEHSSGHTELDQAALDAVNTWHFNPIINGEDVPVASTIIVPFYFKLPK